MNKASAAAGGGFVVTQHAPERPARAAAVPEGHVVAATPRKFTISVNGEKHTVEVTGDTPLLYVLRDHLGIHGPKFGCGLVECGACAVLLNGKQIRSCVQPISSIGKDEVTTIEGLAATWHGKAKAAAGHLHPLQQAWIDKQVPQCGYCQSGMMIQAAELLSKNKNPSVAQIKQAMNGHLCRCGTYMRIVDGIQEAARVMRTEA